MNTTPTALAAFCAALLSGCSSAPTLPVPSGDWEDFIQQPLALSSPPPVVPAARAAAAYRSSDALGITLDHPVATASKPVPAVSRPAIDRPALTVSPPPSKPVSVATVTTTAPSSNVVPAVPKPSALADAKPATPAAPAALSVPVSKPSPAPTAKSTTTLPPAVPAATVTAAVATPPVAKVPVPVTPKPVVVMPPPPPPPKVWRVSPEDKTIREALAKWARSEGWTFNPLGRDYWTVPKDFDLVASDTFTGSFKDVVRKLIASTELTDTPLQPCFYSNRAVRVVPINEECAAQAQSRSHP